MIYIALHIKLKIDQHGAPESSCFLNKRRVLQYK
jgi:hypothetical protein